MLLIILQNTYEHLTNSPAWKEVFWESYTGKRLREMLPEGIEFVVTNASKTIGDGPASVCRADGAHITAMIERVQPDRILACGKVAQAALEELGIDFLAAPHPAWRQLSKEKTAEIRAFLDDQR